MMSNRSHHFAAIAHPRARAAFTLLEVMISIAIVLVLIVGINQVFKIAADTVGTGQVLAAKTRDARAVHSVFFNELAHMVPQGLSTPTPFVVINSRTRASFRDARDQQSDIDYAALPSNPTQQQAEQCMLTRDLNGDNVEGDT